MRHITVEDLPHWHALFDGLGRSSDYDPEEMQTRLRGLAYSAQISCRDNLLPTGRFSSASIAAKAIVHLAHWPTEASVMRMAHRRDVFRWALGDDTVRAELIPVRLRDNLWVCSDAVEVGPGWKLRPWVRTLVLAHCAEAMALQD